MRCPSEGDLRAMLVDGTGDGLHEHVRGCAACRARVREMERAAHLAHDRLGGLARAETPDPAAALRTFKANMENIERKQTMSEFGKKRNLRPAFAGGLAVAALAAVLLLTPLRTAAAGLFDVFRVEKFAVITVDPSKMPVRMEHRMDAAGAGHAARAGGKPNPDIFGEYEGPLKPEKAKEVGSIQAASRSVGRDLATAGETLGGDDLTGVYVSKPVTASYTFDTGKMRARLEEAGVEGIRVPQQLDGETFTFRAEPGVVARYGGEKSGVLFAQGPSPELTIPEGVNMDYLRQDFLTIPGLPADLVRQVQEIEDWQHTLIIPVPANGSSRDVVIDGNEGVAISDAKGEYNAVLWQRDGQLYAVAGTLSAEEALDAARSIRYP